MPLFRNSWLDQHKERLKKAHPGVPGWKPPVPEEYLVAQKACDEFYESTLKSVDATMSKRRGPVIVVKKDTGIMLFFGEPKTERIFAVVRFCKNGLDKKVVPCREMALCQDWVTYAGEKRQSSGHYVTLNEDVLAEYILSQIER